jgi:hypothetical protein
LALHHNILGHGAGGNHPQQQQDTQTKYDKRLAVQGRQHNGPRHGLAGAASFWEDAAGEELSFLSLSSFDESMNLVINSEKVAGDWV